MSRNASRVYQTDTCMNRRIFTQCTHIHRLVEFFCTKPQVFQSVGEHMNTRKNSSGSLRSNRSSCSSSSSSLVGFSPSFYPLLVPGIHDWFAHTYLSSACFEGSGSSGVSLPDIRKPKPTPRPSLNPKGLGFLIGFRVSKP